MGAAHGRALGGDDALHTPPARSICASHGSNAPCSRRRLPGTESLGRASRLNLSFGHGATAALGLCAKRLIKVKRSAAAQSRIHVGPSLCR